MNYKFIDLDLSIETECNMKISDLFAEYGEEYFRKIERRMLLELCDREENCIVSTGGGAPCYQDNMDIMNECGMTIYINLDRGILCSRLMSSKKKRPLIASLDETQLKEYVVRSLSEREPYYNKAKISIVGKNIKPQDILLFIQSHNEKIL